MFTHMKGIREQHNAPVEPPRAGSVANIVTPDPGSRGRMLLVFNTDDQEAPAES